MNRISTDQISLKYLRISAYLFHYVTGYDNAYEKLIEKKIAFSRKKDLGHVMKFLNQWGCRHLSKANHEHAAEQIKHWFNTHSKTIASLPELQDMEEKHYDEVSQLFNSLASLQASKEQAKRKIKFSPVAASKFLLLVKPNCFAPWDNTIAENSD